MPYTINTLDSRRTAIIVVDMQNDFVAEGAPLASSQARGFVPALAAFLGDCRARGVRVAYTAHAHRADGTDMARFGNLFAPIAARAALVAGTDGVAIYPGLEPQSGEPVIEKRRYSGFFATDLDVILREWGVDTVAIVGATTENCCHATARDALFLGYRVAFLADLTGTFDYPDMGWGPLEASDVHRATLAILAFSTAHVMDAADFLSRIDQE